MHSVSSLDNPWSFVAATFKIDLPRASILDIFYDTVYTRIRARARARTSANDSHKARSPSGRWQLSRSERGKALGQNSRARLSAKALSKAHGSPRCRVHDIVVTARSLPREVRDPLLARGDKEEAAGSRYRTVHRHARVTLAPKSPSFGRSLFR